MVGEKRFSSRKMAISADCRAKSAAQLPRKQEARTVGTAANPGVPWMDLVRSSLLRANPCNRGVVEIELGGLLGDVGGHAAHVPR